MYIYSISRHLWGPVLFTDATGSSSLLGLANIMEVTLVADRKDDCHHKADNNAAWRFVSSVFKSICSSIRWRKLFATCWWETYEKEYSFYQLCCPYPPVAFAGCGSRQHSGHCRSEIAFTEQSTRNGVHSARGEPGASHRRMEHRDGQCTLSLVPTQRIKARFYCYGLAALVCRLCQAEPAATVSFLLHISHFILSIRQQYRLSPPVTFVQLRSSLITSVQELGPVPLGICKNLRVWVLK